MPQIIAVDIGTTAVKAVLFDEKGNVLAREERPCPMLSPAPGRFEQNPEVIYRIVCASVCGIMDTCLDSGQPEPAALSFSSAMHSLLALDSRNEPITNAIIWMDTRSEACAAELNGQHGGLEIYRRTGTPIHAMSPLVKLFWMKREEPHMYRRARRFISIKEYVLFRMSRDFFVDYSMASATGLFNLVEKDWDKGVLTLLGLDRHRLSEPVPTDYQYPSFDSATRASLKLPENCRIVIGASDGCCANLGVDAISEERLALTIGTSGAIRRTVKAPLLDDLGRSFCYILGQGYWVVGGPVNNGGVAYQWMAENLFPAEGYGGGSPGGERGNGSPTKADNTDSYQRLSEWAGSVPAGAEGLLFHPYLTGERAPLWMSEARASFFGCSIHHDRRHFARALMEGVVLNLRNCLDILRPSQKIHSIKLDGGFTRSMLWNQMVADIFGAKVELPENTEAACLGAAILAFQSLGVIDSLEQASEFVRPGKIIQPIEENSSIYRELAELYDGLTASFREHYRRTANLQERLWQMKKTNGETG